MAKEARADRNEPLEYVRTFWVMVGPSNVPLTCALYRTKADGFELRAGQGEQDVLLSQQVFTSFAAQTVAALWRSVAEAQGFRATEPAIRDALK